MRHVSTPSTCHPEPARGLSGRQDSEREHSESQNARQEHHLPAITRLGELQWPVVLGLLGALALAIEYYFVAIFLLGGASYIWHVAKGNSEKASTMTATLDAVNELISAGNVWDSAVNEAVSIIEKEERSIFYGPTNPRSPSSGLRISLQSSLHTTQTQCDNVRQLISALTDPSQLSQLSEMYAPSSPLMTSFSFPDHPRPASVPMSRQRTTSAPTNKRATWNGSYAALAHAGSPTAHLAKRRDHRRSDVYSLFADPASRLASVSAPPSPQVNLPLHDVQEEDDTDDDFDELPNPHESFFGAEALDLQRKRRSAALETFGVPPPSYSSHQPRTPSTSRSATSSPRQFPKLPSSSRFTAVHTTRHPLSLSGLQLALHGALSAKRYACSHLLALRFGEDEDDSYWEDVRSLMALLTSTFEDASARLMEALDDAEKKRVRDERPSPEPQAGPSAAAQSHGARTMAEMISFAPMPSHLTRFAVHVDAISSALNDARDHLEQCVAALYEPASSDRTAVPGPDGATVVQEHPAFQAYDRLRKELGYALRECERGRERLLDIVSPRPSPPDELDPFADDTPGLGRDSESEASDRLGPTSPAFRQTDEPAITTTQGLGLTVSLNRDDEELDDATSHLLLTASSQHLPPPGVEQVYEADPSTVTPFTRERSKLSREERIKLMKARRGSSKYASSTLLDPTSRPSSEQWGPSGEVVQELKDVIWKVSEKRRKMSERPDGVPAMSSAASADDTFRTERSDSPFVPAS
ncbi:uncharacterized protein LAESUDRAFT_118866 [Laetiporus sulphureus 93-53]|uniref:Myosin-binding domain-containing protein n=1 Tax=Laetiporus sulphureus 93-53 TaxID=1314785 RepID=A0A165EJN5_9APHY|nr:uncharacterized protein LAESUDRAFT_118866 [Laetiporus sulphureus 93-53]KZT07191.1 hypothetical protein LAESUDRAFT_118866 [Laetiporus sulphureus 93-53]